MSEIPMLGGGQPLKAKIISYSKQSVYFTLPFTYPSWNVIERMHWRTRKKRHDAFLYQAGFILRQLQLPRFTTRVKISVDLYFKKRRRRDNDNYGGKWLQDTIVKAGIIPDDSTKWIPDSPDIQIIDDEGIEQTVVQINEI